jgi:DNA topoisomerase-1
LRRLLLAEKFSAALRLATILSEGTAKKVRADGVSYFTFSSDGREVVVMPLAGHIVELDYPDTHRDWTRVSLDGLVDTEPERRETSPALHDALRAFASTVDEVVLATDYDREGELIGVEALETITAVHPSVHVQRARFSAMTPWEIRRSFEGLTEPDWNLARAASARQKIDLAWGAVLTRFLTVRCGSDGQLLSAGRVQTPTLALVAEMERSREDFVPRTFWNLLLEAGEPPVLAFAEAGPFWDRSGAEAALALANLGSDAVVEALETTEAREHPPSPFNTTAFLAEASRLRLTAPRAMAVAQRLYERGEISYPRTDNTVYPPSLDLRGILERLEGSPYREWAAAILAQPDIRPTRGHVHTTDHPPIHPTGAGARTRKGPEEAVYDLIVRRFLATLSPAAVRLTTEARLRVGDGAFLARGERIAAPGWRLLFPIDSVNVRDLSVLQQGVVLAVRALRIESGRTRPPPLHTQASLLLAMERLGLGTKSTRHEILGLLFQRRYVEGGRIRTTVAGRALVDALTMYAPDLAGPEMTRRLEERMDDIAQGRATVEAVVDESRDALHRVLVELTVREASLARWLRDAAFLEKDFGPCDACGRGRFVRRRTRTGWTFLGCSEFPRCRQRMRISRSGERIPWASPKAAVASS